MFTGAKEWGEVYGRTEGGGEGELESDALQDLCGESCEGGSMGLHEEREGGEGGCRRSSTERAWSFIW
jgi:hypothetical protein